jgi:ParB-like chromosome segregation protein Spo0J
LAEGECELPIEEVKFRADLYPRSQVMQDWVARLRHFLRELPTIEVNQRHELIDGWHRWEAFKQAKSVTIRVRVTEVASDMEHLCLAIKRNSSWGEPLPLDVELQQRDRRRAQEKLQRSIAASTA